MGLNSPAVFSPWPSSKSCCMQRWRQVKVHRGLFASNHRPRRRSHLGIHCLSVPGLTSCGDRSHINKCTRASGALCDSPLQQKEYPSTGRICRLYTSSAPLLWHNVSMRALHVLSTSPGDHAADTRSARAVGRIQLRPSWAQRAGAGGRHGDRLPALALTVW